MWSPEIESQRVSHISPTQFGDGTTSTEMREVGPLIGVYGETSRFFVLVQCSLRNFLDFQCLLVDAALCELHFYIDCFEK